MASAQGQSISLPRIPLLLHQDVCMITLSAATVCEPSVGKPPTYVRTPPPSAQVAILFYQCKTFLLSSTLFVFGGHFPIPPRPSHLLAKDYDQYSPRSSLDVKAPASPRDSDSRLSWYIMQHDDATTTQRIGLKGFQHDRLDHSKEFIRLLHFVDRPPSSDHDHFHLEPHDLATAPRFVALSYTWGSTEPTYDIIVNDSFLFSIRKNLWVALKTLRSFFRNDVMVSDKSRPCEDEGVTFPKNLLQENGYPLVWIDAICINQKNIPEKNHQVNMMGKIYAAAGCVISWLGEEADNSQCVMKAIITSTHTRYTSVEVEHAMDAFIRRSYWERMWIVQEFVLAKNVVILCGQEGAWWKELVHFWHDTKLVRCAEGVRELNKRISALSLRPEGLAALIFARRFQGDNVFEQIRPLSVHQLMSTFSYGRCQDRRDRIYALLALIEPRPGVQPLLADYTISAETLYYRVVGYAGQVDPRKNLTWFRRTLREALGSFKWAKTEAAKTHEVVSKIVEIEDSQRTFLFDLPFTPEQRVPFTKIQKCLANHLGKPVDSMICEGDWTYNDLIRHFQAFPRGEDPATWLRFDGLLCRWLRILPIINSSSPRDDLSDWEFGSDIFRELSWEDSPEYLEYLDASYISGEIVRTRHIDNFVG